MKIKLVLAVFTVLSFVSYSFALDLSGKVENIHTNKGQKNVKISIVSSFAPYEEYQAVTDSEGLFTVSGLKNNTGYTVRPELTKKSILFPRSKSIRTEKRDISDFNFIYYPKYSVSGTVSGNVKMNNLSIIFKSGSPFFDTALSTIDENGNYKVTGLIYGQEYDIFVNSDFHIFGVLGDDSITISDNNIKNVEIAPVFYGIGLVFDAKTKKGLKDVTVTAVSTNGKYEEVTDTAADGTFILKDLHYGENYIIKVDTQAGFEFPSEIKTGIVRSTVTGLNIPLISK